MQPAPKKRPEVVYRRVNSGVGATGAADRTPGYAPALAPLIIGFLLLLVLLLVLGLQSKSQMTEAASRTRMQTQTYSERLRRLLQLRLGLIKLESEARLRDLSATSGQLTPPWEIRLDQARTETAQAVKSLGPVPPRSTEAKQAGVT